MSKFKEAHMIMTEEEYMDAKIIGWHLVCKNYDGFGGLGIRYLGLKKSNNALHGNGFSESRPRKI